MVKTRILFLGTVWPEPRSSAAGVRTLALVEQCKAAQMDVHFASPSSSNEYEENLKRLGVHTHFTQSNDSSFDGWVRELNPDAVVFDRFVLEEQFGWRVRENCPHALTVVDTQDLHFLRQAREAALKSDSTVSGMRKIFNADLDFKAQDVWARELASLYRSDFALVISSFEYDLLTQKFGFPANVLLTLPFSYRDQALKKVPFQNREHFTMIGNFRHPPNMDAFQWVRKEIWPKIRAQLPNAELHIYGAYPPKEVMEADDPSLGFRVKGPAEDSISTLSAYRALLAPLRFGAGIKGKIADAWAAETPVITTPIGSEGMALQVEFAGLVAETADDFVKHACRLGRADAEAERTSLGLTKFGSVAFSRLFGWEKNEKTWLHALRWGLENREAIRSKNTVGAILRYETFQSKRYLSKWIEEKNKHQPKN